MKDQTQIKQADRKVGINPVIVAVAGAVVGAGIAVAGVVLSDEKNREKIKETAGNLKKQAEDKKREIEKRILEDKKKVKMVVASAKESLDKTTKEVNKAVKSL
ncbi:MAG: hypothetical protein NTZ55_05420 [Candidatus Roizmanbacteria bacterium]|nr:hypothetical protein [Candidatus Roizmanbacteria bacterium]